MGAGAYAGEAVEIAKETLPAGGVGKLAWGALCAAVVGAIDEEVSGGVDCGAVVALGGRPSEAGKAASGAGVALQVS